MSSVTLLWNILHLADSSEKTAAAAAASVTTINLGSTKVRISGITSFKLFLNTFCQINPLASLKCKLAFNTFVLINPSSQKQGFHKWVLNLLLNITSWQQFISPVFLPKKLHPSWIILEPFKPPFYASRDVKYSSKILVRELSSYNTLNLGIFELVPLFIQCPYSDVTMHGEKYPSKQ